MIESLSPVAAWAVRIAVCAVIGGVIWLLLHVSLAWSVYAVSCHASGLRAYWRGLRRHPGLWIGVAWPLLVGLAIATGDQPLSRPAVIVWALFSAVPWVLILITVRPEGGR